MSLLALLALLACAPVPVDTGRAPPEWVAPSLVTATADCSAADEQWSFTATTDAWTGNGQVYLSADGAYVERHPMYSNGAAYDGSADSLRLVLGMVEDFRDVVLGASTAFNCGTPDVAGVLQVNERDGRTVADCRAFGVAPERWEEWEPALACGVPLESAE